MKPKGFTLFEVLVSVVIIGVVMSVAMAGYLHLLRVFQHNEITRQLQREMHFAVVRMGDKIRENSVDYSRYDGLDCPATIPASGSLQRLCVGNDFLFELKDGNILMNDSPLFSDRVKAEALNFYVTPTADPSTYSARMYQLQPKVTVFLRASSVRSPNIALELQTTISSRQYTP